MPHRSHGPWRRRGGLGPISILVNNAGVPPKDLSLEMDETEWDAVMDTNLKGAWLMAREIGRRMVAAWQWGAIINIASVLGWRTVAKRVQSYAVSKAGMVSLTETLALELGRDGISRECHRPGLHQDRIEHRVPGELLRAAYRETNRAGTLW